MVQRKDSLCYVEFLRGKYDLSNKDYIIQLVSGMTSKERDMLRRCDFEALWNRLWCRDDGATKNFNKEYKTTRSKFETLRRGYQMRTTEGTLIIVNLEYILQNSLCEYDETEWGFPKGRRNINELDVDCALREFSEETNIPREDITILAHIKPMEEVFTGSNKVRYKHIYYIARFTPRCTSNYASRVHVDPGNTSQIKEIRDVQWFDYNMAQEKLRPTNMERKELFKRLHSLISSTHE